MQSTHKDVVDKWTGSESAQHAVPNQLKLIFPILFFQF